MPGGPIGPIGPIHPGAPGNPRHPGNPGGPMHPGCPGGPGCGQGIGTGTGHGGGGGGGAQHDCVQAGAQVAGHPKPHGFASRFSTVSVNKIIRLRRRKCMKSGANNPEPRLPYTHMSQRFELLFLEQFFWEFISSLSRTNQPEELVDLKSDGSF